jgi:hypothetical protein
MCLGLIVMTWRSGPVLPWLQAAVFGCAVLWFGLAALGRAAGARARRAAGRHDALMAGAMIWMIFAMPTAMPMAASHGGMPAMSRPATPPRCSWSAPCSRPTSDSRPSRGSCAPPAPGRGCVTGAAAGRAAMNTGMAMLLLAML